MSEKPNSVPNKCADGKCVPKYEKNLGNTYCGVCFHWMYRGEPVAEPTEPSASPEKKCGCVHGDSDPYCPDPGCPNYIAAYHQKPAAPQPVAGDEVCGKTNHNRYGEITCDLPPKHEGKCDFGRLPVAREGPHQCISELVDLRCERDYHEKGNHYAYENGKLIQWIQYPPRARAPEGTPKLEEWCANLEKKYGRCCGDMLNISAADLADELNASLVSTVNAAKKWLADNGYFLTETETKGFAAILRPFITPACSLKIIGLARDFLISTGQFTPFDPNATYAVTGQQIVHIINQFVAQLRIADRVVATPASTGEANVPNIIEIKPPFQRALTVIMQRDESDKQADKDVTAIGDNKSTIIRIGVPELYFHHLRLRVAQDPSLADKIAVFYVTPNNNMQEVELRSGQQIRWPAGFGDEIWNKEKEITTLKMAVGPSFADVEADLAYYIELAAGEDI